MLIMLMGDVNYNLNYSASELFPVRQSRFLGMSVLVPSDVDTVLERQYCVYVSLQGH